MIAVMEPTPAWPGAPAGLVRCDGSDALRGSPGSGSGSPITLCPPNSWTEGRMNRRFEVFNHRQVLLHMRQGETDRSIARAGLMGRRKACQVRAIAEAEGWLDPQGTLPDDKKLAEKLMVRREKASTTSSI